jgi:hypothetical protein
VSVHGQGRVPPGDEHEVTGHPETDRAVDEENVGTRHVSETYHASIALRIRTGRGDACSSRRLSSSIFRAVKRSQALVSLAVSLFFASACADDLPPPQPPPPPVATAEVSPVPPAPPPVLPYPSTRRDDLVETIHGAQVADPYRWLEDAKDPNVAAWTAAEDALARDFLSKLPGRDKLAERFKELFYIESVSTPRHHGNRWFFARRDAGKEKFIVYWHEGKAGPEKVLLDPTTWSADGSAALGVWSVSHDGTHVAYTVKENNSDEATLYVMEVKTGNKSAVDVIPGARYASPAWNASGSGFYYTWIPPKDSVPTAERPGYAEIRYHALGTDPAKDRERQDVPRCRHLPQRAMALRDDPAWVDAKRPRVHGSARGEAHLEAARHGAGRRLLGRRRPRSVLRADERRGPEVPRLRHRSGAP